MHIEMQIAVKTLGSRQNGFHLADDVFKVIFLFEMFLIWLKFHRNLSPVAQWAMIYQ